MENLAGEQTTIQVPAGVQPDEEIVLHGEGMPRLRAEGAGDMVAHVKVVVPTDLNKDERAALEQLRESHDDEARVHSSEESGGESFFSRMRGKFRR